MPELVGTTHSNWGAGRPRLIAQIGDGQVCCPLSEPVTRIGSSTDSELWFPQLADTAVIIRHTENDEYIATIVSPVETSANLDPDGVGRHHDLVLRHGAQMRLGGITLVFQRDEYADHGRPYGGRQGGEGSNQPAQPRRPNYALGETVATPRSLECPSD